MFTRLGANRKWNRILNAVVAGFALVGVLQIASWFDRRPPVKVHFRVIQTISVNPGEPFEYLNYFTRREYCDTTVARWFITSDGQRIDIAPRESFMPTEALNILQVNKASITTPLRMPPGESKMCFQSTWMCNPVQRIWPLKGGENCMTFLTKPVIPDFLPAALLEPGIGSVASIYVVQGEP